MNKTTKKLLGLTTAAALCLSQISAFAADPSNDTVFLNGVQQTDVSLLQEYVEGGTRNLMPLRKISELLGASVYWFDDTSMIQIVTKDRMILYLVDYNKFLPYKLENGNAIEFENEIDLPDGVAPQIIDGKTYIPLRAALGTLLIDDPNSISTTSLREKIDGSKGTFDYDNGKINITVPDQTFNSIQDVKTNPDFRNNTYRIKGKMVWNEEGKNWKIENPENPEEFIILNDVSHYTLSEQFRIPNTSKGYDPNGLSVVITGFAKDSGNGENHLEIDCMSTSIRPVNASVSIDGDKDKFSFTTAVIDNDPESVSSEKLPVGATVDIKANEGTDTDKFKVYYNGNALNFENGAAKITVAEGENKLEIKEESVNVELPECFEPITDLNNLKVGGEIEFKVKKGYITNKTSDGSRELTLSVNDNVETYTPAATKEVTTTQTDEKGNEITKTDKVVDLDDPHYIIPVTSENMKITAEWIKIDKIDFDDIEIKNVDYINNHIKFTYDDPSTVSLDGKANSFIKDSSDYHYVISVDAVASGTTVSIIAPTAAPEKTDEPTADNTETKTEDNTEVKTDGTATTPEK